jgi:hypothetical protein
MEGDMPEYRIYQFTKDNHIKGAPVVIYEDSDDEAIKQARHLTDGYDIELWDADRLVTRIRSVIGH